MNSIRFSLGDTDGLPCSQRCGSSPRRFAERFAGWAPRLLNSSRGVFSGILLMFLLGLSPCSRAINTPVTLQSCSNPNFNQVTALSCNLENTSSPNTVVADFFSTDGPATVTSSTETLSCPAGLSTNHNFGSYTVYFQRCFVATASSHATFSSTVTAGASGHMLGLQIREVQGLGTADTGSYSVNFSLSGASASTTTANANEWVDAACYGGTNITPGSGFAQSVFSNNLEPLGGTGGSSGTWLTMTQLVSSASTITSACTFSHIDSTLGSAVVASAWQISGAPSPPTFSILQSAAYGEQNGVIAGDVALANTGANHKIIIGFVTNNLGQSNPSLTCTETCTCPSGTQTTRTNSGRTYIIGICFADTTTTHSQFLAFETDTQNAPVYQVAIEVSGPSTGSDSGSAAAATGQTVNYSTTAPNEFTFTMTFDGNGSVISPGSSFLPNAAVIVPNTSVFPYVGLTMTKTTTASGSSTTSFTGANTAPLIATLSFGASSAATQIGGFVVGP